MKIVLFHARQILYTEPSIFFSACRPRSRRHPNFGSVAVVTAAATASPPPQPAATTAAPDGAQPLPRSRSPLYAPAAQIPRGHLLRGRLRCLLPRLLHLRLPRLSRPRPDEPAAPAPNDDAAAAAAAAATLDALPGRGGRGILLKPILFAHRRNQAFGLIPGGSKSNRESLRLCGQGFRAESAKSHAKITASAAQATTDPVLPLRRPGRRQGEHGVKIKKKQATTEKCQKRKISS